MRLKKLELTGFKSFPTRTEIVFGEGITGIVGPNGSGKSNIGDAVRWVLGEQSAKTLRGASMSDVIFNGTQKRKPLSYCEVSLIFDNEERALPVDYAEVMVTRRVWRTGESSYFLNGTSCRLRDVVDLFRDTGIGREGYSIIGQGRIDDILSRKSEDRRQVFEEAAGIVKYKVRKEEADKRLQRTLENAARIDDILEELSRQLGPLEEQSRDARTYLALSEELKVLDLNLFLIRTERAEARLKELSAELEGLQAALEAGEAALTEKGLQRDACQEQIAALDARIRSARDELMKTADRLHQCKQDRALIASRREHRAEDRERLDEEAKEDADRLRLLEESGMRTADDLREKEDETAQAQTALEKAREKEADAIRAASEAEDALEAHKESIIRAMNRTSAMANDRTRLTTMHSQMQTRSDEIRKQIEEATQEEDSLTEVLQRCRDQLSEEENRQTECAEAHRQAIARFDEADAELIRVRTEAERLSASLQNDQTRWRLLDEMSREMEGYSQSVRRAVSHARERHIPGVKGVLAQLISVPEELETAVDMALGAAQQNIVTDSQETAKALIDYLRENRLGRATFLPMDAVRSKTLTDRERRVTSMPGCMGVASELIQCAPEYREIVENLLGRTVIADNLDHGIPIMNAGNHAFRLVTLAGDVMHTGGSMTGGSTQSRNVSLLSRQRELKDLTKRLQEGKKELEALKQTLADTQKKKESLRASVNEALETLHQQEIAVARETEHVSNAETDLSGAGERTEILRQAMVQLEEQAAALETQLQELDSNAEPFDEDAAAVQTEALQQQVAKARAARDHASDDVMRLTIMVSDAQHALDVMRRDSTRIESDREEIRNRVTRREKTRIRMENEDQGDIRLLEESDQQLAQIESDQRLQESAVAAIETERAAGQQQLSELLKEIDALHTSRERDSEQQHRAELNQSRIQNDLRSMQDRIWNTWELTYAGAEPFRQTEGFKERDADRRAKELSSQIRALGDVNVRAVEQYAETKARFDQLSAQQEDLRKAERDLRELINSLIHEMTSTFTENFSKLQVFFSETFVRLFGGGHAELQLTDPDDPLNCGIEVNAQPPGKKLQLLSLLSGGERALTAIAILFAMLKLKPTPFCILDEIEAALDDANIGYYADYLKEYSESTQFIVVTHRKGTMERCNSLYGVSMEEQGVSKMVSVSLTDYRE